MKNNLIISIILVAVMIISPLVCLNTGRSSLQQENKIKSDGTINVMKTENGKISTVSDKEYLIGVLAAETDLQYEDEALKAQVIASFSYAQHIKEHKNSGEVDISDDPKTNQGYYDEKKRKEKWGDDYNKKEEKAEKIVDSVYGKVLKYNGEIIKSTYFELSSGVTQSAMTVWGEDVPYLQSVPSSGDKLSPDYSKTVVFSEEQFYEILKNNNLAVEDDLTLKVNSNNDGYVNSIAINGNKVSGNDFRSMFELNSSVFTVNYDENKITVKSYGKGHMVGMSQYGADYMAKQGSDYKEILKHYYPSADISEI